jgi:uncharacterized protein
MTDPRLTQRSPTDEFQRYVEAGELRFQRCEDCHTRRWPPSPVCHHCLSPRARWEPASPTATVLSYAVVNEAVIEGPQLPFAVVHAQFQDGVRFTAPLAGAVPADLSGRRVSWTIGRIGESVSAQFALLDGD